MRILIVGNSYPVQRANPSAIAAHFLAHMCEALVARGAEVCVLTPGLAGVSGVQSGGVTVHSFSWSGASENALSNLNLKSFSGMWSVLNLFWNGRRAAQELAREFKPDFVFAAFALPSGFFARAAGRAAKAPYAVWCLGSDIHTWAKIFGLKQLTKSVLASSFQNYADGFGLVDEVTALAPSPARFLATSIPVKALPHLPLSGRKRRILYAGRFEKVKGLDVLFAAWRLAAARGIAKDAELWLAGHGQGLDAEAQAFARDPNVASSVRLLGAQEHSALVRLYSQVDAVVIPSRRESIPVVLSEAVQCGLPVIVTNAGDMGALVEKYALGDVVPCEEPEALATSLLKFAAQGLSFGGERYLEFLKMMDIGQSAAALLEDARAAIQVAKAPQPLLRIDSAAESARKTP